MKTMKRKSSAAMLAALALLLFAAADSARAQSARMKSLMHQINEQIPERQKEIAEGCDGAVVVLEVDFASFGDNVESLEYVPDQGLAETTDGVRRFCTNSNRTSETDPDHVAALKSKVKKIVFKFVPKADQKRISLKAGGVLLVEAAFGTSGGRFYASDIQAKLGEIL